MGRSSHKICSSQHHRHWAERFGEDPRTCARFCAGMGDAGPIFSYRDDGPGGGECACTHIHDASCSDRGDEDFAIYEILSPSNFELKEVARDHSCPHRMFDQHLYGISAGECAELMRNNRDCPADALISHEPSGTCRCHDAMCEGKHHEGSFVIYEVHAKECDGAYAKHVSVALFHTLVCAIITAFV